MSRAPAEPIARALSWGFLAAPEWTRPSLALTGAEVLGRRHRWLPAVADLVLEVYRRPPTDRPDELARFLLTATPLADLVGEARAKRRPIAVRTVITVPGAMGRRRWPVPPLQDLGDVATLLEVPLDQLDWLTDLKGWQRRTPPGPLHLYRYRWVSRPGAVPRLLESPTPLLRAIQRRLSEQIVLWVPVHGAAHGFVRGRSALTNAGAHVGTGTLVCFDLKTFFAGLRSVRILGLFRTMGYPEAVAATLTGLCTHRTPAWVLTSMPGGGDPGARHRLRAELRAPHLPQGAPTSPGLANLACFGLDRRLADHAAAAGLTYTRYADDLAFSGDDLAVPALVHTVSAVVSAEGFTLNPAKTRVRSSGQRQQVTGVVVNRQLGVAREDYDRLRAVLHDANRNGPQAANRIGHPDFRAHLDGCVGWVEAVNPVRGARLRAQFETIVWAEAGRDTTEGSGQGLPDRPPEP